MFKKMSRIRDLEHFQFSLQQTASLFAVDHKEGSEQVIRCELETL